MKWIGRVYDDLDIIKKSTFKTGDSSSEIKKAASMLYARAKQIEESEDVL